MTYYQAGHETRELLRVSGDYHYFTPLLGWSEPIIVSTVGNHCEKLNLRPVRMWGVDPQIMCCHHLLREHKDLHTIARMINRQVDLKHYIRLRLVNTSMIRYRHDQIVEEMESRGYDHQTPLSYNDPGQGVIDIDYNLKDLVQRCSRCAGRHDRSLLTS